MSYASLREQIRDNLIIGPNGNHSARLWRIAESVRDHAQAESDDDRLLHLMSRVGELCRGLAADLRSGHTTPGEAATLLENLAELGSLSFHQWFGSDQVKPK